MDIKRFNDRKATLLPRVAAIAAGLILVACGPQSEEAARREAADNNSRSVLLNGEDDGSHNDVVAACDGTTRVYANGSGYGHIAIEPLSPPCIGVEIAPVELTLTFNDSSSDNDVIISCDGTTRVYTNARPIDQSNNIVTEPNSANCP